MLSNLEELGSERCLGSAASEWRGHASGGAPKLLECSGYDRL